MTPRIPRCLPLLLTLCLGLAPLGVAAAAWQGPTRPATTAPPCSWAATSSLPYEDSNAHYWQINVRADPGLSLTVTGVYPAARYASLQAYTASGSFLTGLPDVAFPPDSGAVNPFAAGGPRGTGSYTLHVVFGPAPTEPLSGTLYVDVPASTTVSLLYRIYLPDTGATPKGNVALPTVTAQTAGSVPSPCPTASGVSSHVQPTAAGVSVSRLRAGTPPSFTRQGQGAVYANGDVAYLATVLWPAQLYVIRFQAPTTPHTLAGQPFDPATQLRYWSLCAYSPSQTPSHCAADEQVPVSANGQVTVALGPWWARPSNATAAHGVTWIGLNWFVVPYTILLRHMLPAPSFTNSAFAVPYGAAPAPYMGTYAPTVVLCTTAQFQTNQCSG